jgi:hypothetical protein
VAGVRGGLHIAPYACHRLYSRPLLGGLETRPYGNRRACHRLYSRPLPGGHKARPTMGMVESMWWQAGGFVYR